MAAQNIETHKKLFRSFVDFEFFRERLWHRNKNAIFRYKCCGTEHPTTRFCVFDWLTKLNIIVKTKSPCRFCEDVNDAMSTPQDTSGMGCMKELRLCLA